MVKRKKTKKKKKVKKKEKRKRKKKVIKPKTFYTLNKECELYNELKTLLLKITPKDLERITKKVSSFGGVRLAVVSGMFMDREDSPADLLIVSKRVNQTKLVSFMRTLEIELGGEINYSVMTEGEFKYRRNMFDKFLRIMLESPHIKLINKMGYLGKEL